MENMEVPNLVETASLAVRNDDWTEVRALLEYAMLTKNSLEFAQLHRIALRDNIIRECCLRGYVELISVFLVNGLPTEFKVVNHNNVTMLHLAAREGQLPLVKLLLSYGADINRRVSSGSTPIFYAVMWGRADVVRFLISSGADVNVTNYSGKSLFYLAYLVNKQEIVRLECEIQENSPVYEAVGFNRVKFVQMLLEAGADVNVESCNGSTPLQRAAYRGFVAVTQLLLDYGADVNHITEDGETALHRAVVGGHLEYVELLVGHGSIINTVNGYHETPVLQSVIDKNYDIATLLIENGADISLDSNSTVLQEAIEAAASVDVIEYLLENCASVSAVHGDETALEYVISCYNYSNDSKLHIAKLLLIYGSDHFIEDRNGNTVLHWACEMGDLELVEYLIDYGVDVDAENIEGERRYNIAFNAGHKNIVKAITMYHCNKYTDF